MQALCTPLPTHRCCFRHTGTDSRYFLGSVVEQTLSVVYKCSHRSQDFLDLPSLYFFFCLFFCCAAMLLRSLYIFIIYIIIYTLPALTPLLLSPLLFFIFVLFYILVWLRLFRSVFSWRRFSLSLVDILGTYAPTVHTYLCFLG